MSFVAWALAALVCAAVVWKGPVVLRPARDLLMPLWIPLTVMVIAGIFLFATDQGRDLGVGLLGNGQFKLFLLFLALIYWATGSWHTARLALNRRFRTQKEKWPERYEPWLRWLPRLLGVCAHLFAALSLAFAARHAIEPDAGTIGILPVWLVAFGILPVWLVAFVPPAAILLGTWILWLYDRPYAEAKRRYEHAKIHYKAAGADARSRAQAAYAAARRRLYGAIAGLAASGVAIIGLMATLGDRLPAGLASATYWVLASAILFLIVVSCRNEIGKWIEARTSQTWAERLRRAFEETDNKRAFSSTVLAVLLSVVALFVGGWTWLDPVGLGEKTGSMVIAFFAFGAYIAVIDVVRIGCDLLPYKDRSSPHEPCKEEDRIRERNRRSGARFAAVCVFLLLLAVATSATRDFHRIRLCGDPRTPCAASAAHGGGRSERWEDHRPTVAEAATAWYQQAARHWPADQPVPMLIIATAGGGIRAAYWTATILEQLERDRALGRNRLRRHLFAISGVSGGSVGAAAYVAAIAGSRALDAEPTRYLKADFLAPAVAATAFIDGPSAFLPELGQPDRGYALERAWEVASAEQLARPFLSFFPSEQELLQTDDWRPALLLNATHQDTGRRVITSHLQVERHVFLDSFDVHRLLQDDMPASAAAHNSARFTYVSPAGKLVPRFADGSRPQDVGFLLDGGYFENFGALTARQLMREARRAIDQEFGPGKVRPVILQISSDPSLTSRDRARLDREAIPLCSASEHGAFLPFQRGEWEGLRWKQRDGGGWISSFLNELTAPIAGIMASRVARGTLASQELAHTICIERRLPATPSPPGRLQSVALSTPNEANLPPRAAPGPEFVHLAMCDDEERAIVPPLGWALSPLIRDQFPNILERCGNPEELKRLSAVFGARDVL